MGDVYMTLIHTCELNRVNPYEYLVSVMRNSEDVEANPSQWLPWNYRRRQESIANETPPEPAVTAEAD